MLLVTRIACIAALLASTASGRECTAQEIGTERAGAHRLGRYCITNNDMLKDAQDCTVIDYFCVAGCSSCTDFNFNKLKLEKITGVDPMHGRSLSISGSKKLRSIRGLSNLKGDLPGSVVIESMAVLKNLNGLEGITAIGVDRKGEHSLVIAYTEKLESVKALENAKFDVGQQKVADGMLWVQANKALTCTPDWWPNRDQKSHRVPHGECPGHEEL